MNNEVDKIVDLVTDHKHLVTDKKCLQHIGNIVLILAIREHPLFKKFMNDIEFHNKVKTKIVKRLGKEFFDSMWLMINTL